ncbi:MAG: cystathionine beta-synthase [Crocinitomicaceae bacterium]
MSDLKMDISINEVIKNVPNDWVLLTTHRLDIYEERLAKTQFLEQFEELVNNGKVTSESLGELPTAFDYIRLGHPLSCVMEWTIAGLNGLHADSVISFSSRTIPIMAVLRKNLFLNKSTRIVHNNSLPSCFDEAAIKEVYGYDFDVINANDIKSLPAFDGSTVVVDSEDDLFHFELDPSVDFYVRHNAQLGSVLLVNGENNTTYISEIQHVRRRETIAMTPANCLVALNRLEGNNNTEQSFDRPTDKLNVLNSIRTITNSPTDGIIGSSGLSMQYAIVMGLIHEAITNHPGKDIKIVVPPNCYGGTNDQARRVAACLPNVEVMDLPVDSGNDMVNSVDAVLSTIAELDAVPYIIAEIPTNPRVEVPDLDQLRNTLSKERFNKKGKKAVEPVFILDQTFCPNVQFLGDNDILSNVKTISYVSGSKFPSGGLCTAGYCVANAKAASLMQNIEKHIQLCDNEATDLQMSILAKQLPSMLQRIQDAYKNTREFVSFIEEKLPTAKINFVSEELASQGFTPSVFSLDLPTKGETDEEREQYKRSLNHKLINMMISEIPNESKYCVSYGQLKGCYWTIPATSTQGTTKEGDKDYIARVALSGAMDLDHHKRVFERFVAEL